MHLAAPKEVNRVDRSIDFSKYDAALYKVSQLSNVAGIPKVQHRFYRAAREAGDLSLVFG